MKLNIFAEHKDTIVSVSIDELQELYSDGWSNGSDDDCYSSDSDTEIECEVLDYVEVSKINV